jgi:hypothetical protein
MTDFKDIGSVTFNKGFAFRSAKIFLAQSIFFSCSGMHSVGPEKYIALKICRFGFCACACHLKLALLN